jgi:quercetin dioxygenase-like cupin family protein
MVVKARGEVPAKPVDKAVKTEIEWLIDRNDGAPNFELRKFKIRPGGSIPKHYHDTIEHEQYVLAGDYELGLGNKVHKLKPGDSVFVPAGTVHWYRNTGRTNAEFLCIIPKVENYQATYLEEEATVASKPRKKPAR